MSESHMSICKTLSLAYFKPYDVIYEQGDIGDSFYYILNGTIKQTIHKLMDSPIFSPNSPNRRLSSMNNINKYANEFTEFPEDGAQIIEVTKSLKNKITKIKQSN